MAASALQRTWKLFGRGDKGAGHPSNQPLRDSQKSPLPLLSFVYVCVPMYVSRAVWSVLREARMYYIERETLFLDALSRL
jgi:hypothetical protein